MDRQAQQKPQATQKNPAKKPDRIVTMPKPVPSNEPNEGEGSRTAARRYNEETREYIASGRSDQAAASAAQAVDSPEGDELRAAEEVGKKGHPQKKH